MSSFGFRCQYLEGFRGDVMRRQYITTWRWRHLELRHRDLCFYEDRNQQPSVLPLNNDSVIQFGSDGWEGKRFILMLMPCKGAEAVYFATKTAEEQRQWLAAITEAIHDYALPSVTLAELGWPAFVQRCLLQVEYPGHVIVQDGNLLQAELLHQPPQVLYNLAGLGSDPLALLALDMDAVVLERGVVWLHSALLWVVANSHVDGDMRGVTLRPYRLPRRKATTSSSRRVYFILWTQERPVSKDRLPQVQNNLETHDEFSFPDILMWLHLSQPIAIDGFRLEEDGLFVDPSTPVQSPTQASVSTAVTSAQPKESSPSNVSHTSSLSIQTDELSLNSIRVEHLQSSDNDGLDIGSASTPYSISTLSQSLPPPSIISVGCLSPEIPIISGGSSYVSTPDSTAKHIAKNSKNVSFSSAFSGSSEISSTSSMNSNSKLVSALKRKGTSTLRKKSVSFKIDQVQLIDDNIPDEIAVDMSEFSRGQMDYDLDYQRSPMRSPGKPPVAHSPSRASPPKARIKKASVNGTSETGGVENNGRHRRNSESRIIYIPSTVNEEPGLEDPSPQPSPANTSHSATFVVQSRPGVVEPTASMRKISSLTDNHARSSSVGTRDSIGTDATILQVDLAYYSTEGLCLLFDVQMHSIFEGEILKKKLWSDYTFKDSFLWIDPSTRSLHWAKNSADKTDPKRQKHLCFAQQQAVNNDIAMGECKGAIEAVQRDKVNINVVLTNQHLLKLKAANESAAEQWTKTIQKMILMCSDNAPENRTQNAVSINNGAGTVKAPNSNGTQKKVDNPIKTGKPLNCIQEEVHDLI